MSPVAVTLCFGLRGTGGQHSLQSPHSWSLSGLCLLLSGAVPLSPISQYADDTSLILTSDDGSFSVSHDALVYGTSSAHVSSSMSVSSTKAC